MGAETTSAVTNDRRGIVYVIDDETALLNSVGRILTLAGYSVHLFENPLEAVQSFSNTPPDVVLTDIRMPSMDGLELCSEVKKAHPDIEVIVMTGVGTIQNAVEAMKAGAYDFLTKPFATLDVITLAVEKALERRRLVNRNRYLEQQTDLRDRFENIVGASPKMQSVFRLIESVAAVNTTVLILGESGTGKELVARAIHERSPRKGRRFIPVNCSAITESLLESELFGHAKGSFTGATQARRGLFEEASSGTMFLDEVGEINLATQVKILRFLQEGEIRPVGSNDTKKLDVRVIAATNIDLPTAIKAGRFREDLYYRLNVVPLQLPPLRDRPDDIPILAHHFIRKYSDKLKKKTTGIDPKAIALLATYRWPGNVRELENTIERLVVLAKHERIEMDELPETILSLHNPAVKSENQLIDTPFSEARQQMLAAFDRRYIRDCLLRAGGIIAEAARLAQMDRSNFRRLMKEYDVDGEDFRQS